jgi:hypothetical protein
MLSLDVLCDFVIKSWEKVKVETVIKSFKKCDISNDMRGMICYRILMMKQKPTRQIQDGTHMTTLSTVNVRTYLTSCLPRTTNVMILQDFKHINKLFILSYNGFCL